MQNLNLDYWERSTLLEFHICLVMTSHDIETEFILKFCLEKQIGFENETYFELQNCEMFERLGRLLGWWLADIVKKILIFTKYISCPTWTKNLEWFLKQMVFFIDYLQFICIFSIWNNQYHDTVKFNILVWLHLYSHWIYNNYEKSNIFLFNRFWSKSSFCSMERWCSGISAPAPTPWWL